MERGVISVSLVARPILLKVSAWVDLDVCFTGFKKKGTQENGQHPRSSPWNEQVSLCHPIK